MSKAKELLEMLNEDTGNWTIEAALNSLKIAMIHSATKMSNPNTAAIGLRSFEGLEKKFSKKKSSSDPEDFKKLLRTLPDYFTTVYSDYNMPEYPAKYTLRGLNKVVKAIANHIGVEVDKKKKSWEV